MRTARPPLSVRTALVVAALLTLVIFPTPSNRPLSAMAGSALAINGGQVYQTIDGMGVNLMSYSFRNGDLLPALDLLATDLGSGLWRVIIECDQGCEDTNDDADPSHFNWTYYNALYETPRFQALWGTLAYLRDKPGGIVVNVMARAPAWMGGSSITAEDEWVEMIASFVYYARVVKGLRFEMLSPINEPDADGNEGPLVSAAQSARLMRKIAVRLPALGLSDLRLVPPETTNPDIAVSSYIPAMLGDPVVMAQIDHYGVHSYYGLSGGLDAYIKSSPYPAKTFWMTEFADKCYVGCDYGTPVPDEWTFAKNTVLNLFSHVRAGATGLLVYEGYDAWYDHHGGIGTTGLLAYNAAARTYTPRLRYSVVKQAIKFVPPGSVRIGASSPDPALNVLAFFHAASGRITIAGFNSSSAAVTLNATLSGLPAVSSFELYQTSPIASFQRGPNVAVSGAAFTAQVAGNSFFTLTTAAIDTVPPSIRIDTPTDGSTVAGLVSIRATASDDAGVTGVQFQIDDVDAGVPDTAAPYGLDWDTTTAANGPHTITGIARDAAGHTAASTIIVGVSNAPPVAVPDVAGLTQSAAAAALGGAGLTPGAVTTASSATVAPGLVISQSPVAGSLVAPGTAVNLLVSSGPSIAVPNVLNLTQGAASIAITDAGLTTGLVTTATSTTVAAGSVISENPVAGTLVASGSAVNLVVSTGPPRLAVDKVAFSDGSGTRTISGFSTAAAGEVLVAFAASDGPSPGAQTLTVSGAGLTWTLVRRVNTQAGTSEIWRAAAAAVLTNVSIACAQGAGSYHQSLTVVAFAGAAGTGASAGANALTGAPTVSLTTTQAGSLVYGVGNDWDRATARTPGAGQTLVHQYLASAGDTMWVQNRTASVAGAGTVVSINDTAPTTDRWNLAAVEIVPAMPPLPTVPSVVNLTQAAATAAIANAGLVAGTVSGASSATVPAGSVISQDPAGGTQAAAGSAVNLVVALATVPDVVNSTQAAATTALTSAGLAAGTITTASSPSVPIGSVIAQSAAPGSLVSAGTRVDLVVSSGVIVPSVVGQTEATATALITSVAGLTIGTATTAPSASVASGLVISQNPAGNTSVSGGASVALVVSSGPQPVPVPNVVGLTQAAATTVITGAGLRVGAVTTAPSTTIAAGSVLSQDPAGGTEIATGSAVNLVVALAAVPNVVNSTQAAAMTALVNAGLAAGTITTAPSPSVPIGSVSGQSVPAGSFVPAGTRVDLVISSGVTVPPVVGQTQAAATALIASVAGLTVGPITTASSTTVAAGVVISQTPAGNAKVSGGTSVALVVSSGPPPVAVPNVVGLTRAAATAALTNAGLLAGAVTTAPSASVPIGSVTSQSLAAGSLVAAGTRVDLVISSGVSVPLVVGQTQVAATSAIAAVAGLTVGPITTASSATVAPGLVISQNPAGNTNVPGGTSVALVVSSGALPGPAVDQVINVTGRGARTTAAFSTAAPGELLVAFVGSDGPSGAPQTVAVTGAGLTWTLVRRANTRAGTSEVWKATAVNQLTNVTVRSTQSSGSYDQSLTVVAFRNASGVGASAGAGASSGAPSVSLTTTAAASLVYGIGNDWDRAVGRTLGPNQTMVQQWVDTATGDTFWLQRIATVISASGALVQINDTAPATDQWNFVAVEILSK